MLNNQNIYLTQTFQSGSLVSKNCQLVIRQKFKRKSSDNIKAPKINHTKHKIYWDDDGIAAYQELLSDVIPSLQTWEALRFFFDQVCGRS